MTLLKALYRQIEINVSIITSEIVPYVTRTFSYFFPSQVKIGINGLVP